MVRSKGVVSLKLSVPLVALLALALPGGASAQPTNMYTCVESNGEAPTCVSVRSGLVAPPRCPGRLFGWFIGFMAWYPLRNVGPIQIEIEAGAAGRADSSQDYPLYVQIVPLDGVDPNRMCGNEPVPAPVVMTIVASLNRPDPCNFWESSGFIDISSVVPVGGTYALRLYSFQHRFGTSPGIDCVRVTAQASATSRVKWGAVKWLYQ